MTTIVQKWGNSLAVRIPHPLAKESHISRGTEVEMMLVNGKILVKPKSHSGASLSQLLKRVTPKNVPTETDWGNLQGKEVW